jgi:isoleucyl-tRNA synthetase
VVNPNDVVEKVGVDVLRLYILSSSAPWDDLKFNWEGVGTINRAINILWNVYRFPIPYMVLDKFEPKSDNGVWDDSFVRTNLARMPDEDRFIISRVNTLASAVDAAMKECQLHRATRELVEFILEDLSRWYVQLVRPRMWLEGESGQKVFAYETIYYVLRRLMGILAPFCPHLAEEIYLNLRCRNDPASIHLLDWNAGDAAFLDETLEGEVAVVRSFDEACANARQSGKRKLRWPVAEVVVVTKDEAVKCAIERLNAVCRDRANAKKVSVVMDRWDRVGWHAEPVMKALGRGFGKDSFRVKGLIEAADGNAIKAAVDAGKTFAIAAEGTTFEIGADHVTFTEKLPAEVFSAPMNEATVYVDVALTPDLESEGYAREVIRRIQEMRKQADLAVEDTITAEVAIGDPRILALLNTGAIITMIRDEVRATRFGFAADGSPVDAAKYPSVKEWDVEGVAMTIGIIRT